MVQTISKSKILCSDIKYDSFSLVIQVQKEP